MNSLSWTLYLADLCGNIGVACACVIGLGGTAFAIGTFAYALLHEKYHNVNWPVYLLAAALLFTTLTPTKNTVMMIAASQAGQYVLENPKVQQTGDKLLNAINGYLDQQSGAKKEVPHGAQ